MKRIILFFIVAICCLLYGNNANAQTYMPQCFTDQMSEEAKDFLPTKSITDLKIVRVNFHFMLKTDGSLGFTETNDGWGNPFSGYDYVRTIISWMNYRATLNNQMNIPTGNSTPVLNKNYSYVLDAVYFHRNDATHTFLNINYNANGMDKNNVFNIFLSYDPRACADIYVQNPCSGGAYASNIYASSNVKFTEGQQYWQGYVRTLIYGTPMDWHYDGVTKEINHELCHLMTLSHTVKLNSAPSCGTGCIYPSFGPLYASNYAGYGPIDIACDDGCTDTPTAWEITNANNCTKHPDCGWGQMNDVDCSNNLMDYAGGNVLSPCQIGRIHSAMEGGLRPYLACNAVATDATFNDLGYPKVSYFGKKVTVGNVSGALADISTTEKLAVYFSESVEISNFEVMTGAEFEIFQLNQCSF